MDAREIETVIARRFGLPRTPTLVARASASKHPIIFTHLRSAEAQHRRSLDTPREQAFSLQVPLGIAFPWRAWFSGKQRIVSPATPGNAYLFDLTENPTVALDAPFSTVRFYISQAALDDLAYDGGLRRTEGLYAPSLGCGDPIMVGLAQTLVAAMEQPGAGTGLFVDYIALAFHAHIIHAYGNVPVGQVSRHGGLAPWQVRRACEYIEANLDGNPSITEVARVCGLSTSYFAKAFKQTTGAPPHAWLVMRRIERAKRLLSESTLEIAEIALACGFVDQSHLSRIFVKRERCSPGKWRRLRRN
jgi:AraC family transcriptional regulator